MNRDEARLKLLTSGLLLAVAWLGINALWGLTSPQDTLVSGLERRAAPLAFWAVGAALTLVAAALVGARRRGRGLLAVSTMLLAFVLGVAISRFLKAAVRPPGGIPQNYRIY